MDKQLELEMYKLFGDEQTKKLEEILDLTVRSWSNFTSNSEGVGNLKSTILKAFSHPLSLDHKAVQKLFEHTFNSESSFCNIPLKEPLFGIYVKSGNYDQFIIIVNISSETVVTPMSLEDIELSNMSDFEDMISGNLLIQNRYEKTAWFDLEPEQVLWLKII